METVIIIYLPEMMTNLLIEHSELSKVNIFKYQFKLKEYMEAIDKGFQKYLQQLEKEGVLPLKIKNLAIH